MCALVACDESPLEVGSRGVAIVGDGVVDGGERCDDGNTIGGDGCSASGQLEPGYACPIPGRACGPDIIAVDANFDCSNQSSFGSPAGVFGWEAGNPAADPWKTTPSGNNGVAPVTDDLSGSFGEPRDAYENFLMTGHPLSRDISIEADMTSIDDDAMGLVARFTNGASYYACYVTRNRAATCGSGGGDVGPRVAIVRAGSAADCTDDFVVASQAAPVFAYGAGFTYRMRLSVIGNTVSCIVDADRDGILGEAADVVLSYTDPVPLPGGMAGLLAWANGNGNLVPPRTDLVFDDVVVRTFDPDSDGDGLPDVIEAALGTDPESGDTDGDGIGDRFETLHPRVPSNTDGTGPIDPLDLDADGDGISDRVEARVTSALVRPVDTDCDGVPDFQDTDSDNDGIPDATDNCRLVLNATQADSDSDGSGNACDPAPTDPTSCSDVDADTCDDCASGSFDPEDDGPDFDGDLRCDAGDPDDDDDGVLDGVDSDNDDPNVCSDVDSDTCEDCSSGGFDLGNDGADFDGDGLCDAGDPDDDGDGSLDGVDSDDQNRYVCSDQDADTCDDCSGGSFSPGNDGADYDGDGSCDVGDPDDDDDGALDGVDSDDHDSGVCSDVDSDGCDDCSGGSHAPMDDGYDVDSDGTCDDGDLDNDNDGIPDEYERPEGIYPDVDGDDIPNRFDLDSDGDGVFDADEAGHGAAHSGDGRVDGQRGLNGLTDAVETSPDSGSLGYTVADTDGDGIPNFLDEDSDQDTISDLEEAGDANLVTAPVDNDNDGNPDFLDEDSDDDTIRDAHEAGDSDLATAAVHTDGDQIPDYLDRDSDGDGLLDAAEAGDADPATPPIDTDGDGRPDFQDTDSDGDGNRDDRDNCRLVVNPDQLDTDGDDRGDPCDGDDDGDMVLDEVDNCPTVSNFQQLDLDADGIGDACDDNSALPPGWSASGGGCAAGGTGAGTSVCWIMLALVLALPVRRRRALVRPGD